MFYMYFTHQVFTDVYRDIVDDSVGHLLTPDFPSDVACATIFPEYKACIITLAIEASFMYVQETGILEPVKATIGLNTAD